VANVDIAFALKVSRTIKYIEQYKY